MLGWGVESSYYYRNEALRPVHQNELLNASFWWLRLVYGLGLGVFQTHRAATYQNLFIIVEVPRN